MKRILVTLIILITCIKLLSAQITCDSCNILKRTYMKNGDMNAYNAYFKYCEEAIVDTIYLDSNNIKVIKSDICKKHIYEIIYNLKDNEEISGLDLYNNDTVYWRPDEYPLETVKYDENRFYNSNFSISKETREKNESGTVYLFIIILENGEIDCVKILRGVNDFLDSDALRYICNMPYWLPAIHNGKKVKSRINYPFHVAID